MSADQSHPPGRHSGRDGVGHVGTTLVILWAVAGVAGLRAGEPCDSVVPVAPAVDTVDPNTAPWWELTVLPRIGESTARRIVEYREAGPPTDTEAASGAFQRAADLERVRGIGPKTVQRIAPYLRFPD